MSHFSLSSLILPCVLVVGFSANAKSPARPTQAKVKKQSVAEVEAIARKKIIDDFTAKTGAELRTEYRGLGDLDLSPADLSEQLNALIDAATAQDISLKGVIIFQSPGASTLQKDRAYLNFYSNKNRLVEMFLAQLVGNRAIDKAVQDLNESKSVQRLTLDATAYTRNYLDDVAELKQLQTEALKIPAIVAKIRDLGVDTRDVSFYVDRWGHEEAKLSAKGEIVSINLGLRGLDANVAAISKQLEQVREIKQFAGELTERFGAQEVEIDWIRIPTGSVLQLIDAFHKVLKDHPDVLRGHRVHFARNDHVTINGYAFNFGVDSPYSGFRTEIFLKLAEEWRQMDEAIVALKQKINVPSLLILAASLDDRNDDDALFKNQLTFLRYFADHYAELDYDLSGWKIELRDRDTYNNSKLVEVSESQSPTSSRRGDIEIVMEPDFIPKRAFERLQTKLADLPSARKSKQK